MIKKICKNINILKKKSVDLKPTELNVVYDLIDTLTYHLDKCVGMAANMIGINKNVIVIALEDKTILPLINPTIVMKKGVYETSEGCLSLEGERPTKRYKHIKVDYLDINFNPCTKEFNDFEAEIIQHEIDHLFGRII